MLRSESGFVGEYSYSFNGMEKDDEVKGNGNHLDFGARCYDSRLGRWLSLDAYATEYPSLSDYVFVANSPIIFIDPDGNKIKVVIQKGFLGIGRKMVNVNLDKTINKITFDDIDKSKLSSKAKQRLEFARIALQNDIDNYDSKDHRLSDVINVDRVVKLVFGKIHSATSKKVTFNPLLGGYYGTDVGSGNENQEIKGSNSPAELMSGEFRHLHDAWFDPEFDKRTETYDADWDNKEERYNYEEFENKILGVERSDHSGVSQKVENVLDKPVMLPKDSGWEIDGKGGYYKDDKKYSSKEVKSQISE